WREAHPGSIAGRSGREKDGSPWQTIKKQLEGQFGVACAQAEEEPARLRRDLARRRQQRASRGEAIIALAEPHIEACQVCTPRQA
ncbi:hypothetical protein, partial [Streptomyces sp900116325]|uniref:hypothetical protein n=1 Tax=Streptomyces sp. 900116325 TaxID=3154295 RepID=UPI0033BD2169